MRKFVPYVRTAEGYIHRISYAVFNSPEGSPEPYVHEETLVGWPESQVFWAKNTGPSVGIAPLVLSPADRRFDGQDFASGKSSPQDRFYENVNVV